MKLNIVLITILSICFSFQVKAQKRVVDAGETIHNKFFKIANKKNSSAQLLRGGRMTLNPSFTIAKGFPDPERNFTPSQDLISAGDLNGDGHSDFYYKMVAADETTDNPNDQVNKMVIYYGSEDGITEENSTLIRKNLNFVGDITGDGRVEAFSNLEGTLKLYRETSFNSFESPQEKEVLNTQGFSYNISVNSFGDFNKDGFNDLIVYYLHSELETDSSAFYMIYGANTLENISVDTLYHPNGRTGDKNKLFYADLDNDGNSEILRAYSFRNSDIDKNYGISVFQFNNSGMLEIIGQDTLSTDIFDGNFGRVQVLLADVNGNGKQELLFENEGHLRLFKLSSEVNEFYTDTDSTMIYVTSPSGILTKTDYNADNKEEILILDDKWNKKNMPNLLTFDSDYQFSINEIANNEMATFGSVFYYSKNKAWDLNSDGFEDIVVEFSNAEVFGYRVYFGNEAGTFTDFNNLTIDRDKYTSDRPNYVFSAGDLNADGIDDFGIAYSNSNEVHLFLGGTFKDNPTPDFIIDERDSAILYDPVSGDINGDGISDLIISKSRTREDLNDASFSIYFGGAQFDSISDHTVNYYDVYPNAQAGNIGNVQFIGDLNNDGYDDIMFTAEIEKATTKIIFGAETLPSNADDEFPFFSDNFLGVGDFNEDELDDVAVVINGGSIQIYPGFEEAKGESIPEEPFITFSVPQFGENNNYDIYNLFGHTLAAGDFDGDGVNDLAATVVFHYNALTNASLPGVQLFKGGAETDSVLDGSIYLLRDDYGGLFLTGEKDTLDQNIGTLATVPDQNGDLKDELLFAAFGSNLTNAGIYYGGDLDTMGSNISVFLEAPDKSTGLGPFANYLYASKGRPAVGDFNNDGKNDVVVPQLGEINYLVDPVYIYTSNQFAVGNEEEIVTVTVTDFRLNQNYPNPFNPTTKINYTIPSAGEVTLEVYDITGRLVSTVVDQRQTAGNHTMNFDASALASGIYIYRLQSAGLTQTRKMTLVK